MPLSSMIVNDSLTFCDWRTFRQGREAITQRYRKRSSTTYDHLDSAEIRRCKFRRMYHLVGDGRHQWQDRYAIPAVQDLIYFQYYLTELENSTLESQPILVQYPT